MDTQGSRRGAAAVVVVLALLTVLGAVVFGLTRRGFPRVRGTVELEGLNAPVEIIRDRYGVPHIYASTSEDLFFAEGYAHAQDRFWQMEFWRRIGSGRLSEYFGEATLGTDAYIRTMGFARYARQEYEQADPETRAILDAYAEGVNAYILNRPPAALGLEFQILAVQGVDVQIEPWTPVNTLTWVKIMAQDLGGNMDDELYAVNLIRAVGLEMSADFIPPIPDSVPPIVPAEELDYVTGSDAASFERALSGLAWAGLPGALLPGGLAFGQGDGIGSNNWVIGGELTDTGSPILANDPHLGIQMPSIWYEVGLHCVEKSEACPYELRGFSFAGAPGIVIGHNDRIAWGLTNVGPDVQDFYVERINPENPDEYEVNGEWVPMDVVHETIHVQGADEPVVLRVRSTRHGPVLTDLAGYAADSSFDLGVAPDADLTDRLGLSVLALRWTALQPNNTFRAILDVGRAQNFDEFRAALSSFDVPSQNFIYADVDGNIGYQMPGLVPIRAAGDGSIPAPGWTDDYEWQGYIPFEELPRAYNPTQGYIATANQPVAGSEYPYLISTRFDYGYRARRINDLIAADTDGISVEDITAIQNDSYNVSAQDEVLPYLANVSLADPTLAEWRERLLAWDGYMRRDSAAAALYGYYWQALIAETFYDQLPEWLWPGGGTMNQVALFNLLDEPGNAWWDDAATPDVVETRDDILESALRRAVDAASEALGADADRWQWGDVHTATFANQTFGQSGIGPIEAVFNRGPVPVDGGTGQVNANNWNTLEGFTVQSLPSLRQIVDLGDLSNSLMVHTTGQSGHPGHPHYGDFIEAWQLGEYHSSLWTREDVEDNARGTLTLQPAG